MNHLVLELGQRLLSKRRERAWNESHAFYGFATDGEWAAAKQRMREIVAAHLVEHRDRNMFFQRCLTLPGAEWRFEQTFESIHGWAPFWIAVERDASVVEYGVRHMPKGDERRRSLGVSTPEGAFSGYSTPHRAHLLHADLKALIRARLTFSRARDEDAWKGLWGSARTALWNWTMLWYDGYATLTTALGEFAYIDRCLHCCASNVPFAVTLFAGHDTGAVASLVAAAGGDAAESRARVFAEVVGQRKLRECRIDRVERYGSMIVVLGALVSRHPVLAQEVTE